MTYARNEGISIHGGSFTATNVATGRGASVNIVAEQSESLREVHAQLSRVLELLQTHGQQIPNHEEVVEETQGIQEELHREKPNRLKLKSMLSGIADSVKSVSGVAIAVEGLKAAVLALLG